MRSKTSLSDEAIQHIAYGELGIGEATRLYWLGQSYINHIRKGLETAHRVHKTNSPPIVDVHPTIVPTEAHAVSAAAITQHRVTLVPAVPATAPTPKYLKMQQLLNKKAMELHHLHQLTPAPTWQGLQQATAPTMLTIADFYARLGRLVKAADLQTEALADQAEALDEQTEIVHNIYRPY